MMHNYIHARLHSGRDDDLIAWLEIQAEGSRSEAVRALLRDGLKIRQMEASLATVVRREVSEALSGLQVVSAEEHAELDANEAETEFGSQLDQLLGRFG